MNKKRRRCGAFLLGDPIANVTSRWNFSSKLVVIFHRKFDDAATFLVSGITETIGAVLRTVGGGGTESGRGCRGSVQEEVDLVGEARSKADKRMIEEVEARSTELQIL